MKLGFIGLGNMASAMIGGIIEKDIIGKEEIIGADAYESAVMKAKERFGIITAADNTEVVRHAEIIVLSVKPQFYGTVIEGIKDCVREGQIVITIAPVRLLNGCRGSLAKNLSWSDACRIRRRWLERDAREYVRAMQ